METRHITSPIEIKSIADDGTFEGYGAFWGNVDFYDDIIEKGAFVNSLAAHKLAGDMPSLLWQHDSKEVIGIWQTMVEDADGLYCKGLLLKDDVKKAAEAYSLIKNGAIRGLSVGINTKVSEYDNNTGVRTIKEAELWECSIVTWPANSLALINKVNSIKSVTELEKFLRDAGMTRKTAKEAVHSIKTSLRDADNNIEAATKGRIAEIINNNIATLRG